MSKLSIDFGVNISSFEKLNDKFTKAKCYVMALGKNRNYSAFKKETVDAAYSSLLFIPVIGHLLTNEDGKHYLGGHDYEFDKDTKEFKSLCVPFGVTIPDESPKYEDVVEPDGTTNTYLTSNIILWTGRYPELLEAIYSEDVMFGQSMEIDVNAMKKLEDDKKYTEITDFTFDALCMLNKSDDEFHVEPCFPSASIVPDEYSADANEFKALFAEMRDELKLYFGEHIGGTNLGDVNREPEENIEDVIAKFAATYNDKRTAINEVLRGMRKVEKDDKGVTTKETWYYLMDFDDTHAYVNKDESSYGDGNYTSESKYFKVPYSYNEAEKTAEFTGEAVEIERVWLTAEERAMLEKSVAAQFTDVIDQLRSEYEELESNSATVSENYAALENEAEELRAYKANAEAEKRKNAINAVCAKFEAQIGNVEDYINLKSKADDYTIEEFEHECYAIKGRFYSNDAELACAKAQFSVQLPIDNTNPFDDVTAVAPYGGIVEYYKRDNSAN